jgi:hypothetical protein
VWWVVPVRRGREVTLVLCTPTGRMLGALPVFDVAIPFWQDVAAVADRARAVHGVDPVVLRILYAEAPDARDGGAVTYLAQVEKRPRVRLRDWPGDPTRDHPLRLDYARPGGPSKHLAWAKAVLHERGETLSGRPRQIRTWNLSSIWQLPTSAGVVWLKVVPPFLSREAAMLAHLSATVGPPVLAADRDRVLLADVPGEDQYLAAGADLLRMVDLLLAVQREWVSRADELLALGAVDWRRATMPARISDVLERYRGQLPAVERRRVERVVDGLDRRLRDVERCGVPDSLVHGDFHPGNIRGTAPDFVILDWGEVGLGHPMLDQLAFCSRLGPADRNMVEDHWARRWQQLLPGADPARAATLLRPVRSLMGAVIYQDFLSNIEPDEQRYHLHDPLRSLRDAAK